MKPLIASLLFAAACASSGTHVGESPPAVSLLTVHNERPDEATIYVMHDGYKGRRLGEVNGLATTTFVLTESDAPIAADIQFLAASFRLGGHSILSDPVIVQRGATYDWKLLSAYGHDALSARYSTR
jgi:hypothetical protein